MSNRRVKLWLCKKHGLHVNQKKVLRVMRKYGLLAEISRPSPQVHTKRESHGLKRMKTI